MWFPNFAVERSVAKNLSLVFEVADKSGEHHGSIIIKQSRCQYYDSLDNHRNRHFTLLEQFQVPGYISSLEERGWRAVPKEEFSSTKRTRERGWFMVLESDSDHYTPEVTVLNDIHKNDLYKHLVKLMPFRWLAEEMFLDEYRESLGSKRKKRDDDVRGNLRWDVGRTGLNSTDSTTLPGIYAPGLITKNRSKRGQHSNETREDTMVRVGLITIAIADLVANYHPNKNWDIAKKPFSTSRDRAEKFALKPSEEVHSRLLRDGLRRYRVCSEATSIVGTGETLDMKIKKTEPHRDAGNADNDTGNRWSTYNRCPTMVCLVDMTYSAPGEPVVVNTGRVCANAYCKASVSQSLQKMDRWKEVLNLVKKWSKSNENSGKSTGMYKMYEKFQEPPADEVAADGTWTYDADANKDCFYSLFVNEILWVAEQEGHRDLALMIEALQLMPFTPSPNKFREGIRGGYERFARERAEVNAGRKPVSEMRNLILHCVKHLKETGDRRVGGGDNCRYQGQGKDLDERDTIFQSVANLQTAIKLANKIKSTRFIVNRMKKVVSDGGVYGVGPFHAQQLIDVATKVGLITDLSHVENVCISGTTETAKRLRDDYGVTDKEIMGLSLYIGKELGRSPSEVENMLCEALRSKYNDLHVTRDVFARGHSLYQVREGYVVSVTCRGSVSKRTFPRATVKTGGTYGEEWWTGGWQRSINDVEAILKKSKAELQ